MSWHNKVVWSEGLFLRPQLFQQQERYFEYLTHRRSAPLGPFFWGFSRCEMDEESLLFGKLVFKSGAGVFPDGAPFDLPGCAPPPPLTIAPEHQGQTIYLAVPLRLDNTEETAFSEREGSLARFLAYDTELRDSNAIGLGPKPVQLASLRLRLLPERELTQSWIGLPLTRVEALHADGSVTLHSSEHIPPVTGYGANSLLREWVVQLHGLTRLRGDALAAHLSGVDGRTGPTAEMVDYLLLQVLNRYEPLLEHINHVEQTTPVDLYRTLAMYAGELATFLRPQTRRPPPLPAYDHAQLYPSIKPLVEEILHFLNQVLIRGAQPIPLTEQAHGIRTAATLPAELAGYSNLVLEVGAQLSPEVLQQQFLAQTKISQPQHLQELIHSHLPGLTMVPLPIPPRQIPFNSGFIYFELLRSGPFWEQIARQGGLALHVAGHFPELKIKLWGIRQK